LKWQPVGESSRQNQLLRYWCNCQIRRPHLPKPGRCGAPTDCTEAELTNHSPHIYTQTSVMAFLKDIAAIAKGMSVTLRELFQPTVVENYPDGPGPLKGAVFQDRYRGVHVLQRDENGLEKCVACFLCAAACPSNCIYIEAAENTAEHRISGAERYAKVYNIDYNRCIFCGYCVEACPTDAITHGHGFEIASFNASNLVYRKEQMLAPVPAHLGANAEFSTGDVPKLGRN
jgi:NADH-quinone oxidoreductase subunit I